MSRTQPTTQLASAFLGAVRSICPRATVMQAAAIMGENQIGALLVVDDQDHLVGILSERDVIAKVVSRSQDPKATPVEEIMTAEPITCDPAMPLTEVQHIMAHHRIRHLPIVDQGKPVGMLSSRDVLSAQFDAMKEFAQQHTQMLCDLEHQYPGITSIRKDTSGRVVI